MFGLLNSSFFEQYSIIIVLVVALGLLMFFSYRRKKTEDTNRSMLNEKLKIGASVKTYSGIYGKVISVQETTDGKVLVLETGEGDKVSYVTMHANAVYDLDNKQPVVLDNEGKPLFAETKETVVVDDELESLQKLEEERLQQQAEENKVNNEEPKTKTAKSKK